MSNVTLDQIQELLPDAHRMSAGYLLVTCPWHDDSKQSLLVYPDGWVCMGECQTSGPLWKLYAELSSPGTTKRGAWSPVSSYPPRVPSDPEEQAQFVYEAHQSIVRNESFRWYAQQRGIEGRIESCELGWHEGWLVVPVKDRRGNINGIILRSGPQAEKLTGIRFTQPTGQRAMIYSPDWSLLSRKTEIYLVFGMIDALTLSELRLAVVTTTGGAKSFKTEWLDEYRKPIIVVPDTGEEPQAYSLLTRLDWRGRIKVLKYPAGFKDSNDYLRNGKREDLLKELIGA